MVLERTGFLFEGETKSSFWVGDEVSDDWIYGMTRPEWQTWHDRPRHPPDSVNLVEVTTENVATVCPPHDASDAGGIRGSDVAVVYGRPVPRGGRRSAG